MAHALGCMWNHPQLGIEPVAPALAGGCFTTEPSGKLCHYCFKPLFWGGLLGSEDKRPLTVNPVYILNFESHQCISYLKVNKTKIVHPPQMKHTIFHLNFIVICGAHTSWLACPRCWKYKRGLRYRPCLEKAQEMRRHRLAGFDAQKKKNPICEMEEE